MKTINGTKGTSAMNRGVLLPKISDFWDSTKDAIPRFAAKLEALPPEFAEEMTNMIPAAVTEHVRVLLDQWLHWAAFIVAEDLYRTANAITAWTSSVADYLACSAGTFFRILSQRGCHLHYVIDNSCQEMQRPLELFPLWFLACGIHYECPQLLESSGTPPCDSRGLATQHLRQAFAAGRHYLFLDTDSTDSSFEAPIEQLGTQGVLTIVRNEAPVPGSGARIYLSGKPLAWEGCQSHPSTMKTFANHANSGDE